MLYALLLLCFFIVSIIPTILLLSEIPLAFWKALQDFDFTRFGWQINKIIDLNLFGSITMTKNLNCSCIILDIQSFQ